MNTGPVPVLQPPRTPTGERAALAIPQPSWLEERLGLAGLQNAILGGEMPGGASLWHALGSVAAGLFVVEAVTGIFLALFYAPSIETGLGLGGLHSRSAARSAGSCAGCTASARRR